MEAIYLSKTVRQIRAHRRLKCDMKRNIALRPQSAEKPREKNKAFFTY
jgi:hypothetical protein